MARREQRPRGESLDKRGRHIGGGRWNHPLKGWLILQPDPRPFARPWQLAQPSGDLFLGDSKKGARPQCLLQSRPNGPPPPGLPALL